MMFHVNSCQLTGNFASAATYVFGGVPFRQTPEDSNLNLMNWNLEKYAIQGIAWYCDVRAQSW